MEKKRDLEKEKEKIEELANSLPYTIEGLEVTKTDTELKYKIPSLNGKLRRGNKTVNAKITMEATMHFKEVICIICSTNISTQAHWHHNDKHICDICYMKWKIRQKRPEDEE